MEGVRWRVTGPRVTGTTEVWVEPVGEGAVLHTFVRVDPLGRRWPSWWARWRRRRTRAHLRRVLWGLKDVTETASTAPVSPAVPGPPTGPPGSIAAPDAGYAP